MRHKREAGFLKFFQKKASDKSITGTEGDADTMITGLTKNYRSALKPVLQTIGLKEGVNVAAGMYILITKKGPMFLADTTVNRNPNAEEIAEITMNVAKTIKKMRVTPIISLLSYLTSIN